jgi:hypothetical protein
VLDYHAAAETERVDGLIDSHAGEPWIDAAIAVLSEKEEV